MRPEAGVQEEKGAQTRQQHDGRDHVAQGQQAPPPPPPSRSAACRRRAAAVSGVPAAPGARHTCFNVGAREPMPRVKSTREEGGGGGGRGRGAKQRACCTQL